MLANGVKQTSSTGGTGALTVANVAGSVPLASALALNQPVAYSIYTGGDSAPVFREAGVGYLSASNTLVRARVAATFDGTTYNASNPSATDFAGAALTIICTPHAATLENMLPTVDAKSANVRRMLISAARTLSTTASGPTALSVQYMPMLLRCGARISSLGLNVTVGAGSARIGLYACSEDGYIGPQLATTGDIDTSTTGFKQVSLANPITLAPGWYFTGYVATSGSLRATCFNSNSSNIFGGSPLGFDSSMNAIELRTESVGSLALPATPSATTSAVTVGNIHPAIVYLGPQ